MKITIELMFQVDRLVEFAFYIEQLSELVESCNKIQILVRASPQFANDIFKVFSLVLRQLLLWNKEV